jgi:hypothetical protein
MYGRLFEIFKNLKRGDLPSKKYEELQENFRKKNKTKQDICKILMIE